jgi:hypothetical protein
MNLLHEPPVGFDGISKTFAMAKHMPTTHRLGLKIGLANEGVLFAQCELAPPQRRRVEDSDPSFIRKAPVELWPG